MDGVREFLDVVEQHGGAKGHLLGLLHVLIGRKISKSNGEPISSGMSWRELATELKRRRWDPETIRELGLDPKSFAPRDRQRFWYSVISQVQVGSPQAAKAGDKFATIAKKLGYQIGPAPGGK